MADRRKPPRLELSHFVDLPVLEASGLAARRSAETLRVLAVGDRSAHVAAATYSPASGLGDWQTIDLSAAPGWPVPADDSQLEAIAVDGGCLVALMREDPPLVLVADAERRTLRAQITLTAPPGSPLAERWDDPSSRGEGLVLLRNGRLLVAKEKRPCALVEFGPVGTRAGGLDRSDFLAPGESWDAPTGEVEFEATAMWRLRGNAKDALRDISALAVGRDRSLWLLSDKSSAVARLSLDVPLRRSDDTIRDFDELWRLPKQAKKPEGFVALDDEHVLVAMDTGSTRRNGLVVRRPTSNPDASA
jgi:hypothetical protein